MAMRRSAGILYNPDYKCVSTLQSPSGATPGAPTIWMPGEVEDGEGEEEWSYFRQTPPKMSARPGDE